MTAPKISPLFQIHLAVLCISTSGPLGRWLTTSPPHAIWWRCILGAGFLGAFLLYKKQTFRLQSRKHLVPMLMGSILLAAHWVTYFYSLQVSSVAIAMISLFTFPAMTALLEPLFFRTPLRWSALGLGAVVLVGVYVLSPGDLEGNPDAWAGIGWGLVSALSFALRNLLLKTFTGAYPGTVLMWYQLAFVGVLGLPMLWLGATEHLATDWPAILTLSLLTTTVGHTLFVMALRHFEVSKASVVSSVQPLWGIVLAALFLHEIPELKVLLGGSIVMVAVVIASWPKRPAKTS